MIPRVSRQNAGHTFLFIGCIDKGLFTNYVNHFWRGLASSLYFFTELAAKSIQSISRDVGVSVSVTFYEGCSLKCSTKNWHLFSFFSRKLSIIKPPAAISPNLLVLS